MSPLELRLAPHSSYPSAGAPSAKRAVLPSTPPRGCNPPGCIGSPGPAAPRRSVPTGAPGTAGCEQAPPPQRRLASPLAPGIPGAESPRSKPGPTPPDEPLGSPTAEGASRGATSLVSCRSGAPASCVGRSAAQAAAADQSAAPAARVTAPPTPTRNCSRPGSAVRTDVSPPAGAPATVHPSPVLPATPLPGGYPSGAPGPIPGSGPTAGLPPPLQSERLPNPPGPSAGFPGAALAESSARHASPPAPADQPASLADAHVVRQTPPTHFRPRRAPPPPQRTSLLASSRHVTSPVPPPHPTRPWRICPPLQQASHRGAPHPQRAALRGRC